MPDDIQVRIKKWSDRSELFVLEWETETRTCDTILDATISCSKWKTDDMLLQVTDYAELVSRPGDFATLRQKNKDGMYTALEQFEVRLLTQLHLHVVILSILRFKFASTAL